MSVNSETKQVAEQQESAIERLSTSFLSNLKQKYSNNKKTIDIAATIVLIAIVVVVIYVNNVSRAKEQAEAASSTFFIHLFNNNEELFTSGENIFANHLGKKGTEAALFLLADQYIERRNNTDRAKEIFEAIMVNYPKNDIVSFATSRLAYLKTYTEPSESIILFNSLIRNFPNSPLANRWRMELAKLLAESDKARSIKLCEHIVRTETQDRELRQRASNLLAVLNS